MGWRCCSVLLHVFISGCFRAAPPAAVKSWIKTGRSSLPHSAAGASAPTFPKEEPEVSRFKGHHIPSPFKPFDGFSPGAFWDETHPGLKRELLGWGAGGDGAGAGGPWGAAGRWRRAWGRGGRGPRSPAGESSLGAELGEGGAGASAQDGEPPLRSPARWGGGSGPGGARRGHDRAAGEGARSPRRPVRGEASRCSAAEPRPLHGRQSPGSLYHGSLTVAPVSRPRALTKPQDRSVASRGRGAAEAVGSPAFQGRADAEGTPGLGVLTGPLQTPPWRASLPPPPPGSWLQHPQPLGGALPRA